MRRHSCPTIRSLSLGIGGPAQHCCTNSSSLDPRHTYPDTYACLAPSHFLVSRYLVPWWLQLLMPKRRPMDNVRVGWKQPQEDEWALCLLGLPTVYRTIAFPRRLPQCPESLALHDLPAAEVQQWNQTLIKFLKSVMVGQEGESRLVLKSPTHTARIAHLQKLFPRARFVHVVRDPLSVFPSTMRLWTRLATDHGLQLPPNVNWSSMCSTPSSRCTKRSNRNARRSLRNRSVTCTTNSWWPIPSDNCNASTSTSNWANSKTTRPQFEQRAEAMSDYQVNRYEVSDELRQRVESRWSDFCNRYGYGHNTMATGHGRLTCRSRASPGGTGFVAEADGFRGTCTPQSRTAEPWRAQLQLPS